MKKNVLITGGTGFVGKQLTKILIENNFSVSVVSRHFKQNTDSISYYRWDLITQTIDEEAVLKADYIIHLAGEGIADKRWTTQRKKEILESRIKPVNLIYNVLKNHNKKLEAFISASGIGYYGAVTSDKVFEENDFPANDFLGQTCQKWEDASTEISNLGIRTVFLRTGIVLGKNEGILKKLAPIFKLKLGSAIGSGKQFMPWIHIDDLCKMYLLAIQNPEIKGAYNAAIEDNTTNFDFSKTMAKVLGYKMWLPNVPSFLLKLMLGEMTVIVLNGSRISSKKIENTGFEFQFKNLELTLENCLK